MGIILGENQYGKAETRVVRIYRDGPRHEIRDLTVTTALRGDFTAAHMTGGQRNVLPTDSQKNTCFAFAKEHGIGEIEDYALTLARHFVSEIDTVSSARVSVLEHSWDRVPVNGTEHDHTWVRSGRETRTTEVTVEQQPGEDTSPGTRIVSGLTDLTLLKSTGSEFWGFKRDKYTTLEETTDRVLATSLRAVWGYGQGTDLDWGKIYQDAHRLLIEQFAKVHSYALQQTLWEMGRAVLEAHPEITEISLSAPNKHHFVVDLSPFGLENNNEVFFAADRPYGLIQCTVTRDDSPTAVTHDSSRTARAEPATGSFERPTTR